MCGARPRKAPYLGRDGYPECGAPVIWGSLSRLLVSFDYLCVEVPVRSQVPPCLCVVNVVYRGLPVSLKG